MSDAKQSKTRSVYGWGNVEDALTPQERGIDLSPKFPPPRGESLGLV